MEEHKLDVKHIVHCFDNSLAIGVRHENYIVLALSYFSEVLVTLWLLHTLSPIQFDFPVGNLPIYTDLVACIVLLGV